MKIWATAQYTPRSDTGQFIRARITPAVRMGVQESGDYVLEDAKRLVPVRTGELRDSGKVVLQEQGNRVWAAVTFTADHAAYVEFGTGKRGAASAGAGKGPYRMDWPGMAAQPYLRPALDSARPQIKDIMGRNISLTMR